MGKGNWIIRYSAFLKSLPMLFPQSGLFPNWNVSMYQKRFASEFGTIQKRSRNLLWKDGATRQPKPKRKRKPGQQNLRNLLRITTEQRLRPILRQLFRIPEQNNPDFLEIEQFGFRKTNNPDSGTGIRLHIFFGL